MLDRSRRGLAKSGPIVAIETLALRSLAAGSVGADTRDVGVVENLMREHGVLRRVLLVYVECMPKQCADGAALDASAINRAMCLSRDFGEEHPERKLKEAYLFTRARKRHGDRETITPPPPSTVNHDLRPMGIPFAIPNDCPMLWGLNPFRTGAYHEQSPRIFHEFWCRVLPIVCRSVPIETKCDSKKAVETLEKMVGATGIEPVTPPV